MKAKKKIKNEIVYFRYLHDRTHAYATTSMTLLNDDRLSYFELGLMVKALSNANDFSFVASYNQEQSGFGQDVFYNASKHLQELGYLMKTPKVGGGWKWIVIESKETIEKLKELNWIAFNSKNKTWRVNSSQIYSIQIPDTVRSSDFPNSEFPITDLPTTDFRNRDLTGKTINKQTSKKELIIKEEKIVNNETTRTSPTLAEAIYKIDEKNENGASEYVMSDYHPKIESLIVLNDVIPDKTVFTAKQDTPVGISANNDIPDKTTFSAKQNIPTGNRNGINYKLFNLENSKKVYDLYQRNIDQMGDLSLPQLEKLFVISVLFRLNDEGSQVPTNFEELQKFTSRINFQGFSSIMNRYKFDNEKSIGVVDKIVEPFSSDYVSSQVDFSLVFTG